MHDEVIIAINLRYAASFFPPTVFRKGACRLLSPCSSPMNFWRWLMNFVPILQWLPKYNWKTDTLHDVIGGLTIGVMHIPQSLLLLLLKQKFDKICLWFSNVSFRCSNESFRCSNIFFLCYSIFVKNYSSGRNNMFFPV
ncbi:unnamed protein product [Onchocerca flexuosa]|uniref:Sulfate_transp domain-containing protein n=1 Tax=Onchocerca flexuosa TaxID=387005 RepID=A0A183HJ79_9BILA|nr:unnamed protein product [Onchocerca flexuosa]